MAIWNIRTLTALPVYNERAHVEGALAGALNYSREVLVVDDGSIDGTSELLAARSDIHLIRHEHNRGYGAALMSAFDFAISRGYDVLVTIDCDGQHQPQLIPRFLEASETADIVSGSRYLRRFPGDTEPPEERQRINRTITDELNRLLGLQLDRRLLRLQGLSNLRACPISAYRNRLCHAFGTLGASEAFGLENRGTAGAADLSRPSNDRSAARWIKPMRDWPCIGR